MDLQLDPSLANGATARSDELGESLVVRSSTIVESSGTWAGAFASYEDLGPGEVPLGIKGCWASAFGAHVLGRAEMSATKPSHFGMAVLVQKQLNPTHGGVASVGASGEVTIAAVEGSPAAIVSGWERGGGSRSVCPGCCPGRGAGRRAVDVRGRRPSRHRHEIRRFMQSHRMGNGRRRAVAASGEYTSRGPRRCCGTLLGSSQRGEAPEPICSRLRPGSESPQYAASTSSRYLAQPSTWPHPSRWLWPRSMATRV